MSEELHMWDYWREKRGSPSEAVEADYPQLLARNWQLQMAVVQANSAQNMIDMIMYRLMGEADANDDSGNE